VGPGCVKSLDSTFHTNFFGSFFLLSPLSLHYCFSRCFFEK
jgi:hypothetical protein